MKIAHILSILAFSLVCAMAVSAAGVNIHPLAISAPLAGFGIASYLHIIPMPANSLMINFGAVANMAFPDVDGRESMGGYTATAYLAFITDIETFPTEPNIETATDVGQLVTLGGNFIMKAAKFFYEVKVPPSSSKFSPASQGEIGGKSFNNTGEIFIPGMDEQSMGLARMLNNKMAVLILPDPDGKTRIVVGTKDLPCTFTPKADSGAKGTDKKGFTFTFQADSFAPGWKYEGAIPLTGGTVAGIS